MNKWLFGVTVVAAAALLVAAILVKPAFESRTEAPTDTAGSSPMDFVSLDDAAKDFELPAMDGQKVRLSRFRGKWVLVNFWATWCPPCLDELPHFAALARALEKEPLVMVLVSVDENRADIEKLSAAMKQHPPAGQLADLWKATSDMIGGRIPNVVALLDPGGSVSHAWGTSKYPETYLVDPQGRRRARFIGPKPWGSPRAIGKIKEMIGNATRGSAAASR
ncbi:MAG: TlpA family protein disulfide reductase [Deltaproteobacteria bacterium]|nr:MAG: TlpA family protein disulfide reductase [Deltaproteobacteria bacterium]